MNNLYEKENLLPYVVEQEIVPAEKKVNIFKRKLEKNGLATTALTFSIASLLFGILIFPSILGITLGVGALIVAFRKGTKKIVPIASIIISIVTLALSTVALVFLIFAANSEEPDFMVPPGYRYDSSSGISYAYNPVSNIPCDANGECKFQVKLYQTAPGKCVNGGQFKPDMQDLMTHSTILSDPYDFAAMSVGDEETLDVTLQGLDNGRLNEVSTHPISCKV